jgi:hypothetical protein
LKNTGYRYRRTRKPPKLSEDDKRDRLNWCLLNRNNTFDDYCFADESFIRILEVPLYHLRIPCSAPNIAPVGDSNKYRAKVNIWGAISRHGQSNFVVS